MHILSLPPEILDMILHHLILHHTKTREGGSVFRLKLVCSKPNLRFHHIRHILTGSLETFSASFNRILFLTRKLDDPQFGDAFRSSSIQKHQPGAAKLWHDYLVFRCRNKQDNSVACYIDIRNVVDHLFQHNGQTHPPDWASILDKVCWLTVECPAVGDYGPRCDVPRYPGDWEGWNGYRMSRKPLNLNLRVLSAATYCGYTQLVSDLLSQGLDPTKDDVLFPSPMFIAARTGQADMLRLFQEHLPFFKAGKPGPLHPPHMWGGWGLRPTPTWRSKIGPGSLIGAAKRGDMDMVRLCLYPPSRETPDDDLIVGYKPGHIFADSPVGTYITWAMWGASSPEIYQYLLSLISLWPQEAQQMKNRHLAAAAASGNVAMVRYFLDTGVDPSNDDALWGTPLWYAVMWLNDDVVDLLLQRGAELSAKSGLESGAAFLPAAFPASMVMMRKLLDAGVDLGLLGIGGMGKNHWALRSAIQRGHVGMVELVLERSGESEQLRKRAIIIANRWELKWMAEELRLRGEG